MTILVKNRFTTEFLYVNWFTGWNSVRISKNRIRRQFWITTELQPIVNLWLDSQVKNRLWIRFLNLAPNLSRLWKCLPLITTLYPWCHGAQKACETVLISGSFLEHSRPFSFWSIKNAYLGFWWYRRYLNANFRLLNQSISQSLTCCMWHTF